MKPIPAGLARGRGWSPSSVVCDPEPVGSDTRRMPPYCCGAGNSTSRPEDACGLMIAITITNTATTPTIVAAHSVIHPARDI